MAEVILIKGMEMPTTGVYLLSVDNTGQDKTIFTIMEHTNSGKIIPRYVGEAVSVHQDGISCRKLRTVQPTNADSIRAMSDDQLAEWLDKHVECMGHDCPADKHCWYAESCKQAWMEWLKDEVSE